LKFTSRPIEEHSEVPLADDGRWEEIVAQWQRREPGQTASGPEPNACYVVAVTIGRRPTNDARLEEIVSLVLAQGDHVVGREHHAIARPNPRMLLGVGNAGTLGERAIAEGATMLVIDAALSPSQTRNLEDATGLAVCDREAVILNVFHRHARTRRARIQVEIAQLEYLRPRIRGIGLEMDQQAGGVIGARGAGETASELFARRLDGRLAVLRKAGKRLEGLAATQRKQRTGCKRIALVGYTNAGKTSLMNALTSAGLSAADRLFETLDATSRALSRHGGDVLISDTVGFIRELPERLLSSFESTLEEIKEASLIAIVVDAADPDSVLHVRTTEDVLERLGAGRIPRLYVFNKVDVLAQPLSREDRAEIARGQASVMVSARSSTDVERLREMLLKLVRSDEARVKLLIPYSAGEAISMAYARCRVIENESLAEGLLLTLEGQAATISKIKSLRAEEDQR